MSIIAPHHITKIAHVADVHIPKNHKRHSEYQEVFTNLVKSLREQKPERIVIVGDLYHDKLNISNEAKVLAADLLNSLAEIAPVRLTRGNHDCFVPGHEVLTEYNGWVTFEDYIDNNLAYKVATFNAETEVIEFQHPTAEIKKDYNGDVIHLSGSKVDMVVTPSHNVLVVAPDGVMKKKAGKVYKGLDRVPVSSFPVITPTDYYAELLGFCLADATFVIKNQETGTGHVQFHLKKERKLTFLTELLDKLVIPFTQRIGDAARGTKIICIYSEPAKNIMSYFKGQKALHWGIIGESPSFIKSFIDGFLHGDGCEVKPGVYTCTTILPQNAEVLTTMARLIGYASKTTKRQVNGNYQNSKLQTCFWITKNHQAGSGITKKQTIPYQGYVYCLSAPNGNLFVRHNGHMFITGNCDINKQHVRMDCIETLVRLIRNPRIVYYSETGFFMDENLIFVVWHHGDHYSPWNELAKPVAERNPNFYAGPMNTLLKTSGSLEAIKAEGKYTFIDLYHDPVKGCRTANGMVLEKDSYLSVHDFQGDLAMLGDIHARQYFTREGIIS